MKASDVSGPAAPAHLSWQTKVLYTAALSDLPALHRLLAALNDCGQRTGRITEAVVLGEPRAKQLELLEELKAQKGRVRACVDDYLRALQELSDVVREAP